jgi:hypothetical protein
MVSSRNKSAMPRGAGVCQPGPHQANGSSYRGWELTNRPYAQADIRPARELVGLDLGDVWEISELMPTGQTKPGQCDIRYGEPATHNRHIHNSSSLPIHECAGFHSACPMAPHPGRKISRAQAGTQYLLHQSNRSPGKRGRRQSRHADAVRARVRAK